MFKSLNCAFRLSVSLGVIGGGEIGGNVAELKKTFPIMRGEDGVAVRDDGGGETMKSDDMLEKKISDCRGREGFGSRNEMGLFCESVNDNKDGIKIADLG